MNSKGVKESSIKIPTEKKTEFQTTDCRTSGDEDGMKANNYNLLNKHDDFGNSELDIKFTN